MTRKTILIAVLGAALAAIAFLFMARDPASTPTARQAPPDAERSIPSAPDGPVYDMDPPLGEVAPAWPEIEPPPFPREIKLPLPPPPAVPDWPSAEAALAESPRPTLLANPFEDFDAFGRRLLAEREKGVELAYVVERPEDPEETARALAESARQVRAVFPAARFGVVAFDARRVNVAPLTASEAVVSATVTALGGSTDAVSLPAALARAGRMDWRPSASKLIIVLPARPPGQAQALESLQVARSLGEGLRAAVCWVAADSSPSEMTSVAARIDESQAISYVRLSEMSLLGREILARLLGEGERGRIERVLSAASE